MRCWFGQFVETECHGPWDKAHLVPKQTLKSALVYRHDISRHDERWTVPACRYHHANFDNYRFPVPRKSLPEVVLSLCDELDLGWYLDRRYGPQKG